VKLEFLDAAQHDRAGFTCGVESVDRYFHAVARDAADRHMAQTYVLVADPPRPMPCEVVGFFTLLSYNYVDQKLDPTTAKALKIKREPRIPMILLGRLGIAREHQDRGVGVYLLRVALERALAIALEIGAVGIITDPYDTRAERFYRSAGFDALIAGERQLFLATRQIARECPHIVQVVTAPLTIDICGLSAQTFKA